MVPVFSGSSSTPRLLTRITNQSIPSTLATHRTLMPIEHFMSSGRLIHSTSYFLICFFSIFQYHHCLYLVFGPPLGYNNNINNKNNNRNKTSETDSQSACNSLHFHPISTAVLVLIFFLDSHCYLFVLLFFTISLTRKHTHKLPPLFLIVFPSHLRTKTPSGLTCQALFSPTTTLLLPLPKHSQRHIPSFSLTAVFLIIFTPPLHPCNLSLVASRTQIYFCNKSTEQHHTHFP
ncbi:MAG: hypothetical protein BYD32DRAFT_18660 [Podila humilis]|nr:MAG: hypothetical protein BYD32DRAFT_18660 [Podila humilis]